MAPHPDYTSQYPLPNVIPPYTNARELVPETTPPVEDTTFDFYSPTETEEEEALSDLLTKYGFDDVDVSVEHSDEDKIIVFENDDNVEVAVLGVDDDGHTYAISSTHNDESDDSEYATIMDLDFLNPDLVEDDEVSSIDLTDPDWLNKSAILALMFPTDTVKEEVAESELFVLDDELKSIVEKIMTRRATGRMHMVVRGGKVMRVPVFRRIRKAVLSPKQRAALRKMQMKAHSARANANRKRSVRRREMMHLR
jgi:hypothetical protein